MRKFILTIFVVLASNLIYSQSWDFTSTNYQSSDFTSVGNSYWIDDGGLNPSKRMRLVALYTGLQGSFWLNSKTINPSLKWTASFTADINYGSTPDADGLAFTIQPTGTAENGNIYYGAYNANALSVSIITYTTNLINVYANNSTTPKGSVSANLAGFTPFNVTVSYAPTTTTLSVALSQAGGPNVSYDVDIDLANELGTTADFTIGFSAQTGGSANNHGIHNFTFDEQIIFVNSSSSGNNDGTSWDDAFTTLQSALDAAVSGDEIWVAKGIYYPSTEVGGTGDRYQTFQMKNGVAIYGGFAGTEISVSDRQIGVNETILSGEIGTTSIVDNCYNIFYHPAGLSLNNTAVLDGFTITKAYANIQVFGFNMGGGIFNDGSSPKIENCKFINNRAWTGGAAIANINSSSPEIINCLFVANSTISSLSYGGAMYNSVSSSPAIINCTFTNNNAGTGGAIYNNSYSASTSCTPTIVNSILWGNTATTEGNEIYNFTSSSIPTISYSDVEGGVTSIQYAVDGGNNINTNPLFARGSSLLYPFSITESSPCLDVGLDAANSLNYDKRGDDFGRKLLKTDANTVGTIDMGAYEYKHGTDQTTSVIFVNSQATSGNNNGSSWADAFTSLQSGLDAAAATSEIWVAKGTYKPSSAYNSTNTSRYYHFEMIKGVEIYGGFAGTETATSQRVNFGVGEANETILSGDIGTAGTDTDNCYHVFFNSNAGFSTDAVLDGFTITKGYADGSSFPDSYGGGLFSSSPSLIRNCTFTNNYGLKGGGVAIYWCEGFVFENCSFINNDADKAGGVYLNLGSNHTFTSIIFSGNSSNTYGGGLYIENSTTPSFNNCLFEGNTANQFGGGCRIDESVPTITNCTFTNNSTVDASGGGAVFINSNSNVTITNSIVWGNTSNGIDNEIEVGMGGLRTVSYSDIRGGLIGTGNININPKFAGSSLSPSYPYSIMGTSPCADVGYNDANAELYDIRGNDYGRKLDKTDGDPGTIDMGAYEYKFGTDPAYTPVIYVNHLAVGNDDGTTWTDAYPSFQSALDEAVSGQQIWVAKGTYKPSQELDGTTDTPREFTFQMVEGVEIYGGFVGSETATSQRTDYGLSGDNETALSGDIGTQGVDTDNCYNVFFNGYSTGLTSAAVLDGFTVTKGYADGNPNYRGGGMYNEYKCPLVRNCNFTYNIALYGGALYMFNIYEETELLLNCNFINNGSLTAGTCDIGGALSINSSSNFTIDGCTFANNNAADDAGSLTLSGATIKMTNCIFSGNSSTNGGALNIKYSSASVFTNCLFENNTSTAFGGAISIEGNSGTTPEPVFNNCTFANNTAGGSKGGALLLDRYSTYTMNNCIAWGNTANGAENEITLDAGATGTVSYSDIRGSKPADVWDTDLGTDGGNNIDANPMFQLTGDYPYAISGVSPCVNTGNNSIPQEANDIRGNGFNRVVNSIIDMGAYEYNGTTDPVNPTLTWTGSSTTDWNTSGNWDGGIVPIVGYNVTIPNLDNDPVIGSTQPADCNNLTVESEATLSIESTVAGTGSLIVGGTSSGNVTMQRYVTGNKWHYVSAPLVGQDINGTFMTSNSIYSPNSGANYNFYHWDEPSNYWIIYGDALFSETQFGIAKGYALTTSTDKALSFTGTIRTSDVTYTATYNADYGQGNNMVGNPFTSSMMATTTASATLNFLTINSALLDDNYEALYIWDEEAGYDGSNQDYKVISNATITGHTAIDQDYIAPGQAFMVKVVSGGGELQFNENMQAHNSAAYYKDSKEVWPSLELSVKNSRLQNATAIGFNENMTKGLDPSYDCAKIKGNPDIALYTRLIENTGLDYAVQALPNTNIEDYVIPVGVDVSETGLFEFSATQEKLDNYSLILEDRQENTFTNLRWDTYFANINESGTGRFFLHFKDATAIDETDINTLKVFVSGGMINISSNTPTERIILSNITGQILSIYEGSESIPAPKIAGVYLVSIENDGQRITQKIIVN